MFTGIIEELGEVVAIDHLADSATLTVRGPLVTSDAAHGSSICVNGVCLTVTALADDRFSVDVMAETLAKTSLGTLEPGSSVNLERAMAANGRFGGHIVQGHVDGTGRLLSRTPGDCWEVVEFTGPPAVTRYLVEKGSVAIDGVSLTVFDVVDDHFKVSLIPTTLALTTLGQVQPGAIVNLEADVIGKYITAHLDRIGLNTKETHHV